jgi:hypothetical protein
LRPPVDDPIALARWRCRNVCIMRGLRGLAVGVIAVAAAWFAWRLFWP